LYEIIFLMMLGAALLLRSRRPRQNGELFRLFMLGYLSWRLFIEFYKPRLELAGPFSAIQMACMVGMMACVGLSWRDWTGRSGRSDSTSLVMEPACPTVPTSSTN
jgi:prolipoprotein diacylglyceryltransferase